MPDVNQNDIQTVTFDELDVIDTIGNGDKMLVKTTDGVAKTIMKEALFREVEANREAGDTLLQGQITTLMGESGLHEKANLSLKGANNGLAELDENGKVPSSQLPSFVDDVIEGYYYQGAFYVESSHTTLITPETGKIYVNLTDDKTYRWGGSAYVVISESLALGETSSTAYRGDRGKTAYDHSQLQGTGIYSTTNPHALSKQDIGLGNVPNVTTDNQTPTVTEASSLTNLAENDTLKTIVGKVKKAIGSLIAHLNNTSNPHTVTKSQVGLGDVVNTGDSATPVSGGTTKFTTGGAYTELAKKVNTTVKVNGHALSGDVTVTKSDVSLGNVVNTGDSATAVNGGDSKFTTGGAYRLLTSLAPYFSASTAYSVGAYVTYENKLYKCTTAHSAGAWNSAHFTETDVTTVGGSVTGVKGDSESSYRTGQVNITKTNIGLGNVQNKSYSTTVTQNEDKYISSGAVYTALSNKVNTSDVTSSVTSGSTKVVTSGGVFNKLNKWTDITSSVTFTFKDNPKNCSWVTTPRAWICGSMVRFRVHIQSGLAVSSGGDVCVVKITSSLFTLPYDLSRTAVPNYYGDSVNVAGLNIYPEQETGLITFRKGYGMTDGNAPAGFDMAFDALVAVQLS